MFPARKILLFLHCFVFISFCAQSQNTVVDSLRNELAIHTKKDTNRIILLNALVYEVYDRDLDEAKELLSEVDELSENLNFVKGKADAFFFKGLMQIGLSEYPKAISYFKESMEMHKSINNNLGVSNCYNGIAMVYSYQDDLDKAIEYFNKSAVINEELDDLRRVAGILNNIGSLYIDQGKYEEAIVNLTKSVEIKEQLNDEKGVANTCSNLGRVYGNQGNYPKAIAYCRKALSIYEKIGYADYTPTLKVHLGVLYFEQGNKKEALENFNNALEVSKKLGNKKLIADCLNKLGYYYKDQANYEKALTLYKEALEINQAIDVKGAIAECFNNVGDIQLEMNQKEEAIATYHKSIVINEGIKGQLGICNSKLGLARCYYAKKDYNQSLVYVLESQEIAMEVELLTHQKKIAQLLSSIHENLGNYKEAFLNHKQFKRLNDSIFNKENIEKITQIEYEYKYKQELDSASIRELKLTKTVRSTSQDLAKSQRNSFIGIIVLLLVSIVSGSIIFFLKLRHANAKNQNILIEQKLLRSQMTPHFIFNSLSVLQGMILDDERNKSITYLSKFSKLLRTILENSRHKSVPLSDELSAIDSYMALQNLDTSLPFDYQLTIDSSIDNKMFKIPPMLIQPFIENSIEHAFVGRKENKEIKVHLAYKEETLICTISDNGIGINTSEPKNSTNKKSLATTITSERLKLLSKDFKSQGTIKVENREVFGEKGTLVTLVIPFKIDSI